jgi:hypothetical protein
MNSQTHLATGGERTMSQYSELIMLIVEELLIRLHDYGPRATVYANE